MIHGLSRAARSLSGRSGEELKALFGGAVELPASFGTPQRRRLFFPLTGLLDVPRTGLFG